VSLADARRKIEAWRRDYNEERPHSSLGYMDLFTLPKGIAITLSENSDIVLLFAETDEDLTKRFPPRLRPV